LYGCGTWSVALREEHRLRVSENRLPRRIFGSKREEVVANWRRLHNALPSTPSWRGALLKKAQGQLYLYVTCTFQQILL